MTETEAVRALGALAQGSRLQIFRALVLAGQGGMTPSRLSEVLGLPGTALSFHLKELLGAGLVTQERDGRNLIYRAQFAHMNLLLGYLTEHCCQGATCELTDGAVDCTTCSIP